jgi:Flp pilus assembly protein TadG
VLNGGKRGRSGVAAVEAALIMPVLIILMLSAYDLIAAAGAWRNTRAAATATAEISTYLAVNSNGTNQLTSTQVQNAATAVYAYLPNLFSMSSSQFTVTLSAVVFAPTANCNSNACVCVTNGATSNTSVVGSSKTPVASGGSTQCYIANTAWSAPLSYGTQQSRPCGQLLPATSTTPTPTTIPVGVYGPYSVMVADIRYTYTPIFLGYIMGTITFNETAYVPPRIGGSGVSNYVQYSPSTATAVCKGYV